MVIRTPFGDTDPFLIDNLVKQGSVQGPILNNCSLDKLVCNQGASYQNGVAGIKPLEFVDDIADLNNGLYQAKEVMTTLLQLCSRKTSFAADKCKVLTL